jgi:hypothetical protein
LALSAFGVRMGEGWYLLLVFGGVGCVLAIIAGAVMWKRRPPAAWPSR